MQADVVDAPRRYAALSSSSLGMLLQAFREDPDTAGVGSWGRIVVDSTRNTTSSAALLLPFPVCDDGPSPNGSMPSKGANTINNGSTHILVSQDMDAVRNSARSFRSALQDITILLFRYSPPKDDTSGDRFEDVDSEASALHALCSALVADVQAPRDGLEESNSPVVISCASSAANHNRNRCSNASPRSATIDLFDDVASFDGIGCTECRAHLASVVAPSLARVVADSNHPHRASGLSYFVLEVEDVASRKRLSIGLFDACMGPRVSSSCDGGEDLFDGRFERGLAHCASMAQRPDGLVVLDTPTADLESSNMDASADIVLQAMVVLRLMCLPQLVDSLVTVARPMTSSVRLAVHDEVDAAEGLSAVAASLKVTWHKALQRRLIEMDLNEGGGGATTFDAEQSGNAYTVLCSVIDDLLLPWIAAARRGPPSAQVNHASGSDHLQLSSVSPIVRGAATVTGRERSEATLDLDASPLGDMSFLPSPVPRPPIDERAVDVDNRKQHKPPIILSPSVTSAVDSLDVAMGRRHHAGNAEGASLLLSARSDTLDVIVPSPDPQRGESLFRFDDSFALSPLRATGVTTDSVLMCEHLREEVRALKATIEVVEQEKREACSHHQTVVEQLQAQLLAEQQCTKRWKTEAKQYLSLAQGSALLIPGTVLDVAVDASLMAKAPSEGSQGSLVSLYPDTPKTPFDVGRAATSPRELRAARKARQSSANPQFFGSPQLGLNNRSLISVPWSDRTPTPRGVSGANMSNGSLISGCPQEGGVATGASRLAHAQALRRALVEAIEAQEARELALTWAQDAVRLSHIFVKRTLKRFHDSVEVAINTQHRLAMEGMERKLQAYEAALKPHETGDAPATAAVEVHASASTSPADRSCPHDVAPHDAGDADKQVLLLNLSMTSALPIGSPKAPTTSNDPFTTPGGNNNQLCKSMDAASQGSKRATHHRLNVSTPGTMMVQSRPETVQAVIMSGRNTKGEERKASGERVPNLRFDQIRSEAVSWKQHQLEEYKIFTAHHVLFFGDCHVGKSSVVACLTNKAPVLFKKPPQVATPTLDVHRTRATVHLTRTLGSSATVPLGGMPRLTMPEAVRIAKESASAREPATLPASATTCTVPISLTEFPASVLRTRAASHAIPRRGAIYCIVFRLTDDVEVSRQAILRYVQHMLALAAMPDVDSGDGPPTELNASALSSAATHTIPFVLIGTHADQVDALHSHDQDMTAAQNALASYRRWLEEEFAALNHSGNSCGSTAVIYPLILDTFAVSCASWMVYGERPKSADCFADMLNDWCTYLVLHAPTAPEHLLPSWKTLAAMADREGPFSDDELFGDDASGLTSSFASKPELAPVMVDYVWARRGGGSQSGGLFSSTRGTTGAANNARPTSLWSRSTAAGVEPSHRDEMAQRWLHGAAMGLITLFTALHRFMEFTGYILDAQMFDNIVLQHLELASRVDEERQLSTRLLRIRDILVEALLVECRQRGFLSRLLVADVTTAAPAAQVIVLGSSWFDSVLVPLMMPYTIQVASTMPTSSPAVRRQFAGVGPRHIVALLQRAGAFGVDLTSGAMPVELQSYRAGHVSRKLLFHLLPAPMNTIAATQRNAMAFLAALNITETFSFAGDSHVVTPSTRGSGSTLGTPVTSVSNSGGFATQPLMPLSTAASMSSIFIPCVAAPVDGRTVRCLDDVFHLVAEAVVGATLQVEMPSMDLFSTAQSLLYNHAVAQWDVAANPATFCGFASRNCFALTLTNASWLLVVAVGGTESDCTFTEYRVVVAHHSPSSSTDAADPRCTEDDEYYERLFQQVANAFQRGGGAALPSVLAGTTLTAGPVAEKRLVESWDASEDRLGIHQEVSNDTGWLDGALRQPFAKDLCLQLRGMLERTQRPCLRTVLRLFHLLT